jgi:hypothetical protein
MAAGVLLWVARCGAIAALVPLFMIVFGEPGEGPLTAREAIYLALFPFGFGIGYLLGWRWPLFGGCLSLACMAASIAATGAVFPPSVYFYWALVSLPGVLYVIAGLLLRARARAAPVT